MVERTPRWYLRPGVCCACVAALLLWALVGPANARDITVVDDGTGKPVPGVTAVFYWEERLPGPDGGYERIVHAREVISGQKGALADSGVLSWLLKSRTLYLYKPGYRFLSTPLAEATAAGRVKLSRIATIARDRRAEAAAFEAVVDPILLCRLSNDICHQNLKLAPAAIYREYEFTDIAWYQRVVFSHGAVVENKVAPARPQSKKKSPGAPRKSRRGRPSIGQLTARSQSPDFRVRQRAVHSLGRSGVPEAVEPLITALADKHWQVRYTAAGALGSLAAVDAAPALANALGDAHRTVRESAGTALAGMGPEVSPVVVGVLSNPNPLARERAVRVLGKTGGAQAVDALIPALNDPNARVRERAAIALGVLNDPRAAQPLLDRLADEPVPMVKVSVFSALGNIGDPLAVAALTEIFLGDPRGTGRPAGRALMAIDPEGIQALASALAHPHPDVRAESADLIGISGNRAGTLPLVAALHDADMNVRRKVIQALGRICDARAVAPLLGLWSHPSADLRTQAANAVVRQGQPAVTPLLGYLKSQNPYYRWRAAWALGNLSAEKTRVTGHKHRSRGTVRERVRDPEAVAALINAVNDPRQEVRWCAIRSLEALAAAEASPALETKLADDDAGIRAAASGALAMIRSQR